MPLTAAQICTLACQEAKCPGFTAQAGQYLNATLQDLCQNYDLDAALGSNPFSFNSGTGNGSGPYTLPADYLRTQVKDGKDEIFYTINGVPYPLIQVTKAEYDWLVQTPGFQSYPYNYATDLSQTPAQLFVWPPASGSYVVTHRYYKLMPDIATPETSATVPWFKNTQILQRSVAGRLMGITGDTRQAEYLGDDSQRYPLGAGTLLNAYLKNVEDREGAVHTVGRDRRRWGRPFDQLKNTKNIGWCLAAMLFVLSALPVHAQSTKAQLNAEFITQYPDNTTGLITPQVLRTVSADIVNSIMPTAPVVASNTTCFDGTTGLLKDCGVAPNPVLLTGQIIVGVTGLPPVATSPTAWFDIAWCSTVGYGIFKSTGVWKCDRRIPIPVTLFGAVADSGGTDNVTFIQAAYDYAAANGLSIEIPRSNGYFAAGCGRNNAMIDGTSLTVANGNKSVSIYGGGWSEKPFATPTGSWILPTSGFPNTCSYIRLSGSDKVASTVYDGFGIGEFGGSLGTPKGLHGIFLDTANPTPTITSGTYNNSTGAVVLTMPAAVNLAVGDTFTISALTGTGGFAALNGTFTATAISGVTLSYNGGAAHGASTITGGTMATPAYYQQNMRINNVYIGNTAAGYSIKCTTGSAATPGCIPDSSITNSKFMNFNADFLADHVTIGPQNTIGQNTTIDARNVGVEFAQCSGCTSTVIANNNFSNISGMVVIHGANKPVIRDNEMEQPAGSTNLRGSMIDLAGDVAVVEAPTVTGNQLAQASLIGDYAPVRVANAISTQIYDNRLGLGKVTPYDYVTVTGGASDTFIGRNRCAYNLGGTTDFDCSISSLGPFGSQQTPFKSFIPGTSTGTLIVNAPATFAAGATINYPNPSSPTNDTFALLANAQALTNKSMSGLSNTFTNIPNSALTNSSTTVNSQTCTLGASCTVTASATSVTVGTTDVLSGTSHGVVTNNSTKLGNTAAGTSGQLFLGVTGAEPAFATMSNDATITNAGVLTLSSVVSAGTTGSSTAIPVITVDVKGRITSITTAAVVAPAGTLTGTTLAANVVNSSLTSFGASPTLAGPIFSSAASGNNTIPIAMLGTSAANTILANATGGSASWLSFTMPSCADSGGNHLNYVNGTGITCGTGASAAAAGTLTGATLASNVLASSLTSVGTLTGGATGAGFTIALTTSTVTGNLPAANMDNTAWTTFTPTPTCGSATFTVTSARSKTWGKVTDWSMDLTISAIGTCVGGAFTFTLPNTPQSAAGGGGAENVSLGVPIGCIISASSTTATCLAQTALLLNSRFRVSGVYENQ